MNYQALQDEFTAIQEFYQARGIFRDEPVFGQKPALVVVDMANGWTDPAYVTGSERLQETVYNIQPLLAASRAAGIPIIFTTAFFVPGQVDPSTSKSGGVSGFREWDERACEIDVRLKPQSGELVLQKDSASAFFGTALVGHLVKRQCDTVIVTGCSTSACIRATVFDAQSYRFKTIVPRECVQDRAEASHLWNLFDLASKHGVVMEDAQVVEYLWNVKPVTP